MTDRIIRPAGPADLAGVQKLFRYLDPNDPPLVLAGAQATWSVLLRSGLTKVFVAEIAGGLVATCTLAIIPNLTRSAMSFGVIENVVTPPDQARTGIGRGVLLGALNAAWRAGCYKVMLANSRDEGTFRFYEDCGFTRGGKIFFEIRRS